LLSLVKEGDFWALAKRLHDDYCDVPRLTTCINDSTSDLMLTLIESIINIWFDRNRKEPEKYGLWKSKKALEDLYEELKMTMQTSKSASHTKFLPTGYGENGEATVDEMLRQDLGLSSGGKGGRKVKRVASLELEAEKVKAKKMKVEWDKILNLSVGIKKMSDTYMVTYGKLAASPEIVHGPSLDE
jgi:hypothetical protein